MKIKSAFLLGPVLLLSSALFAQAPGAPASGPTLGPAVAQAPMTEKEIITELKKDGADQLLKDLDKRGAAFEMDADVEKRLRKAKATDQIIKAVTAAGPKERAAAAKAAAMAGGGVTVSPEEAADIKALQTELDPDKAIALAEAFAKKYPKSDVLSYAYALQGNAYQMKGDVVKAVEYGEKSLELKKDNPMSLLMLAYAIPTPQFIKLHQADEEKQLANAESYAQDALKVIADLKNQTKEPDADFARRKASYIATVHADLGMIHLDRAQLGLMGLDQDELVKAENEYKQAVSMTDQPDPVAYFRMGDACRLQGKLDDAIAAYTKASELGGPVKRFADMQIAALKKAKAQPAAPPSLRQLEVRTGVRLRHSISTAVGQHSFACGSQARSPRGIDGITGTTSPGAFTSIPSCLESAVRSLPGRCPTWLEHCRARNERNRRPKSMAENYPERFQSTVNYQFRNPQFLLEALTHSSFAQESADRPRDNEQMEFLGDAVLTFVVSVMLADAFPDWEEGKLTRARAHLVAAPHLYSVAIRLNLGQCLRLGRGEEKTGGRDKPALLVNALEAAVAALYRDGGIEAARDFIARFIVPQDLGAVGGELFSIDYKSALQEHLQAERTPPAEYRVVEESGPEHQKTFTVEAVAGDNLIARGRGGSKKAAEQEAARLILEKLGGKTETHG